MEELSLSELHPEEILLEEPQVLSPLVGQTEDKFQEVQRVP
jgi:hypothetical protein